MNLVSISQRLTTLLNNNYNYIVTDNNQFYNRQEIGKEDYIPTVLSLTTSFADQNGYQKNEMYRMTFRVPKTVNKDLLYADIDLFKSNEQNEYIDDVAISKVYYSLTYQSEDIINGKEYYIYVLDFVYTYSLTIVGSTSVIKIDTVAIPFVDCQITHDISYISNTLESNNYRMTNDLIVLIVPLILSNLKVSEIYNYINSDDYNRQFTLSINGIDKNVALKKSMFSLANNGMITNMILTFETWYPRTSILLDGVEIPQSQFKYEHKKTILPKKRGDFGIIKATSSGVARSWSIGIVNDGSLLYQKLIDDMDSDDDSTSYTITRNGKTFHVMLENGVEEYTESGDMSIQGRFVENG